MCILSVYTLLKVASYYDLSDGFPKKIGGMGGVSSIQFYFGFLEFFNFAKPLAESTRPTVNTKVLGPTDKSTRRARPYDRRTRVDSEVRHHTTAGTCATIQRVLVPLYNSEYLP